MRQSGVLLGTRNLGTRNVPKDSTSVLVGSPIRGDIGKGIRNEDLQQMEKDPPSPPRLSALGWRAYGAEKAVGRKGGESSHGFWLTQPQAFGENNSLIRSKLCVCTPRREKSRLVAAAGGQLGSVLGGSPRIMTAHMG